MDVTTAYLQDNIDEEIYFEPPSLFEEKNNKEEKGKVWRLKKAVWSEAK